MTSDGEEWLTIAEAARRLAIAPRQARRYAEKLEDKDRDIREDTSGTRQGQSLLYVRFTALETLRRQSEERVLKGGKAEGQNRGQGQGHTQGQGRTVPPAPPRDDQVAAQSEGTLPAVIYQKMLSDKEAEIAYLREQLSLAQQNLAREQMLRALPAPEALIPEASNSAPDATVTSAEDISGVQAPPKAKTEQSEAEKGGWVRVKKWFFNA